MAQVIPLESAVVKRICTYLKAKGAWWVKTTGVSKVGCPDLLVCYRGWFIALEVKRPQIGRVSVKQHAELSKIIEADGIAQVVTSVEEVDRILRLIDAQD